MRLKRNLYLERHVSINGRIKGLKSLCQGEAMRNKRPDVYQAPLYHLHCSQKFFLKAKTKYYMV